MVDLQAREQTVRAVCTINGTTNIEQSIGRANDSGRERRATIIRIICINYHAGARTHSTLAPPRFIFIPGASHERAYRLRALFLPFPFHEHTRRNRTDFFLAFRLGQLTRGVHLISRSDAPDKRGPQDFNEIFIAAGNLTSAQSRAEDWPAYPLHDSFRRCNGR